MNSRLSKRELSSLTKKVRDEIFRIEQNLNNENLMAVNEVSGKDEVDSANDDIIRHTELRFATRETLYLKKLKKTLSLMDSEEYGSCEECGCSITFQRLSARPTSTMCISCKEESERSELQSFQGRKSKSLGQAMNLSGRA
jgi:DnaK suppressor protein